MVLGFSEDFTSSATLDSQLKSIPTSGLYVNKGLHPSVNLGNLLDFLPKVSYTFSAWSAGTTYNSFLGTGNIVNVVTHNDLIYQSLTDSNTGNTPGDDEVNWLETNIESLRLKTFIEQVKARVYSDLGLTKRLVNNQYLYENGKNLKTLPNDYVAWVIEPKGSDYVSFRINEISIQADGTDPINVYVLHQDTLQETIQITPNNGEIAFRDVDIALRGKGVFKLAIASQDVYVGNSTIDPLKFKGFVVYTASGIGISPESSEYSSSVSGIGMGINISAYMDGAKYIDNNLDFIANFIKATFEFMTFQMFLHNPNNVSNIAQRVQMTKDILIAETKNTNAETVVKNYHRERSRVIKAMQKTFDTQLNDDEKGIKVKIGSV